MQYNEHALQSFLSHIAVLVFKKTSPLCLHRALFICLFFKFFFLNNIIMKKLAFGLLIFFSVSVSAQQQSSSDTGRRRDTSRRQAPPPVGSITPTRETPAHDPVMIKQGNNYYLFTTGFGVSVYSSKDMKNWRKEKPVFANTP